jgi:FixJ family two-component response regulator
MIDVPPLIAVVDDDKAVGKALGRLLRLAGLNAETFVSGPEFLESLQKRAPDCVVLDQHMPLMDGFEVQSQLEQRGARLPVIMITGWHTSGAYEHALQRGAAAYLCKPVDGAALLGVIRSAISRARASGEELQ